MSNNNKKLKGGIIGIGRMGLTHLSILNNYENVEIIGMVDNNKTILDILSKYLTMNFYNNSKIMFDDLKLDLELSSNLDLKSEDGISSKFNNLNNENQIGTDVKIEKALNRLNEYKNETDSLIAKDTQIWQIHNKYLVTEINSGLLVIDQHVAHERVLYEKVKKAFNSKALPSQSTLFPKRYSSPKFFLILKNKPKKFKIS